MNGNDLEILGLKPGLSLDAVKAAYRLLAKANHPDCFDDPEKKKAQEKIMARINEAYQAVLADLKQDGDVAEAADSERAAEKDRILYQLGLHSLELCRHKTFGTFDRKNPEHFREMERNLAEAKTYFSKLIREFPESDWSFDSGEKLKELEKIRKSIANMGSTIQYYQDKIKGRSKNLKFL